MREGKRIKRIRDINDIKDTKSTAPDIQSDKNLNLMKKLAFRLSRVAKNSKIPHCNKNKHHTE
jgi:hypothetical protein